MICVLCGQPLLQSGRGRRRIYCSRACQQQAYRIREENRLWRSSSSQPAPAKEVLSILKAAISSNPQILKR